MVRWVAPDGEHGGLRFVVGNWRRALVFGADARRFGARTTTRIERVAWPWAVGDD